MKALATRRIVSSSSVGNAVLNSCRTWYSSSERREMAVRTTMGVDAGTEIDFMSREQCKDQQDSHLAWGRSKKLLRLERH